jgi:hypothetical protein
MLKFLGWCVDMIRCKSCFVNQVVFPEAMWADEPFSCRVTRLGQSDKTAVVDD